MSDFVWNPNDLDLTTCDREPIHIPGSIQPHGVLFVLDEPDLNIVQCSGNTANLLGAVPEMLLDKPLSLITGVNVAMQIQRSSANPDALAELNPLRLRVRDRTYNGILHRAADERLVLELEPAPTEDFSPAHFIQTVQRTLSRLRAAPDVPALCQVAAAEVRRISGFDRVMIYQFDPNWNGAVVAESRRGDLTPYLGLRYPASDIPKQARALYRLNPLRLIRTIDYEPALLLSIENTPEPLNMSFSQLRSVSPIHLEYLRNMGVGASMSVSILQNGELWGLVACHHDTERFVSYDVRAACELISQVLAVQLAERVNSAHLQRLRAAEDVLNRLVRTMGQEEESSGFVRGLTDFSPNALDLIDADGAAVFIGDTCHRLGATPDEDDIRAIVDWLWQHDNRNVFETMSLSALDPAFERVRETASGVLAVCISRVQGDYILWFLPEQIETVHWGGDPTKRATINEITGETRISPRQSFAAWQEVVALKSRRWQPWEVNIVTRLRGIIIDTVLRLAGELQVRANVLSQLNAELMRSTSELDSFAYIASHDLKEPVRGIRNYARFLLEDHSDVLPPDGIEKLRTLVNLSQRMEELMNTLLHFSRVGRFELNREQTDLGTMVDDVMALLALRMEQLGVEVRRQPMQPAACDRLLVSEVFNNLISNAMKYNDKDAPWIEIGQVETEYGLACYVKDNGIGIDEANYETVFQIFKRLHGRDQYGGGTGAGLAIVRKVIERHGGRVWLESAVRAGTTFYFTLAPPD